MSEGGVAKDGLASAFRSVPEHHVALAGGLVARPASAVSNSSSDDDAPVLAGGVSNGGHLEAADPAVSGESKNAFEWPAIIHHDDKRQLLDADEEESSEDEAKGGDEAANSSQLWSITEEQLTYYKHQFVQLQDDVDSPVQGSRAKEFFEKSQLPIAELRAIWQLSDVTRDGCLSLEEFLVAMHLVVLRRNNIELPQKLPHPLQPSVLSKRLRKGHGASQSAVSTVQSVQQQQQRVLQASESLDSPKPVNFDFHRPNASNNPNIVHPVALRASPDTDPNRTLTTTSEEEDIRPTTNQAKQVVYEQLWNEQNHEDGQDQTDAPQSVVGSDTTTTPINQPLELVQTHALTRISSSSESASTQEEEDQDDNDSDDEAEDNEDSSKKLGQSMPPPALPLPRPPVQSSSGHTRSNSLDLTARNRGTVPPIVPPRTSLGPRLRPNQSAQLSIHQYKDKNSVLARTINELHQEVSDILEERISLEFQLEQLKAFGE